MNKEEVKVTEKSESTERTDKFKLHLQLMIYQALGVKVSKQNAWEFWKMLQKGTLKFALEEPDNKLTLAGIGNFVIIPTKGRGLKAGYMADGSPIEGAEQKETIWRYRFYPSQAMTRVVDAHFGTQIPGDEVEPMFVNYGLFSDPETLKNLMEGCAKRSLGKIEEVKPEV